MRLTHSAHNLSRPRLQQPALGTGGLELQADHSAAVLISILCFLGVTFSLESTRLGELGGEGAKVAPVSSGSCTI